MKLNKLLFSFKGLNNTKYQIYVMDEHIIKDIEKKYYNYKVYEIFKKAEDMDSVFISIYKNKKLIKKRKIILIMNIFNKLFCKHDDLKKIRTTEAYDTLGRLTLHRTKSKCNRCGRIVIKRVV